MSDDKWGPLKRAFGKKVSNKKLNARDTAIKTALGTVDSAVARIVTAGLADSSQFAQSRQGLDVSRARIMRDDTTVNGEKFELLGPIQTQAQTLATASTQEADRRIKEQRDAIASVLSAIENETKQVTSLGFPVAANAARALILPVTQARDQAMQLTDEEARRTALEQIDLAPLRQVVAAAKKVDVDNTVANSVITDLQNKLLPSLKDVQAKNDFSNELAKLQQDALTLATLTDFGALKTAAGELKSSALDLVDRAGDVRKKEAALGSGILLFRQSIAKTVDDAKLIQHPALIGMVPGLIDTVEQEVNAAGQEDSYQKIFDALEKIKDGENVRKLNEMLAEAKTFDGGVLSMLAGVKKIIDTLSLGPEKTRIEQDYQSIKQRSDLVANVPDLADAKRAYADIKPDIEKLLDRAAKAGGEAGFEAALEARYHVTITEEQKASDKKKDKKYREKGGKATKFLERTYEMFGMVPEDHVGHEKLTKIIYNNVWEEGGLYSKDRNAIVMDNFKSKSQETYELNGEKIPANKFNVTMLHEIGHAVDEKNNIMAEPYNPADTYGGWAAVKVAEAAAQIAIKAMQSLGQNPSISRQEAEAAILKALQGTQPDKPQNASKGDWARLQKFLELADSLREKNAPWFNVKPEKAEMTDERVYVNAYGADWYSYSKKAYDTTKVNAYQWRSPGEWFAEIYAIAWLAKKPPPVSLDAGLLKYFPQRRTN